MPIPINITKEHLLKAIEKIDREGVPKNGDSQYYDVIFNEKKYPPKLIVSYANFFANGVELDRNTFSGGLETQCFKLLQENDFLIQNKTISYYLLGAAWYGDDTPDQTERFIENEIWENGYQDKLQDVVKKVIIGDRVAIKSSYATRDGKSMLRIKATGTVTENIGDGRSLRIKWDKRFTPFDLEGYGTYRNTIQKVTEEDIDVIFKSHNDMSYYPELMKFITLAEKQETGKGTIEVAQYNKEQQKFYAQLSVEVSFGKGRASEIPWIAFLDVENTVKDGIYPVYLYYKEKKLLILAYGVSETQKPKKNWNLSSVKSISEYFSENNLGTPERYGSSFVFKTYDTTKPLSQAVIDGDLSKLISIYKRIPEKRTEAGKEFQAQLFYKSAADAGLFITPKAGVRFISSLLTKPFVILTGLSGSGKTKLAQAFAMWICEDETQYCMVPVGADWTNREPLLGFPNALKANDYVKPENRVLDLIIDAKKNQEKPYFLILDEMNLSHVERYFADFLSVMESKKEILLHSGTEDWNGVPSKISFPKNLFIVGTVNIDETTYMFSPKVLDRASVIEFRVTADEMKDYLNSYTTFNLDDLAGEGSDMAQSFMAIANDSNLKAVNAEELNNTLLNFFSELKKTGSEFGYRSASEILRFAAVVEKLEANWNLNEITDAAIMQKLLPKVHGSRRKLEPVLKTLGELCLKDNKEIETLIAKTEIVEEDKAKINYPVSYDKIHRMYQNLLSNGFTSYAEA